MSKKADLLRRASAALKDGAESKAPSIQTANTGNFSQVVSTGSTLLDLAISGGVAHEGGVPAGILMEIYGKPGSGKTAILSEMVGNVIHAGGSSCILDPEGRLDAEHAKIYGIEIDKTAYSMPDTVSEMFGYINEWVPETEEGPNLIMTDSLAALSTDMEMKDGDTMGMRRAKEFSEGLRKVCRRIKHNNWIIACTNQVRVNMKTGGDTTPGGMGVPFYASLRIKIAAAFQNKYLKKVVTVNGVKQEKIYGVKSVCTISKSSIDAPYREAPVYLIFDYGIDDLRANLEYLRENGTEKVFQFENFSCKTMGKAIEYAEENNLEEQVRQDAITLWHEIQSKLTITRKRKQR